MSTRQYFYKVDGCEAFNSRKPSCICWHDEGTGPRAGAQGLTWRTKPAPTMTDALAAQQAVMRQALEWYQEQARLCRLIHSEGDAGRNALAADGGRRARAALSATQEKPHDE